MAFGRSKEVGSRELPGKGPQMKAAKSRQGWKKQPRTGKGRSEGHRSELLFD